MVKEGYLKRIFVKQPHIQSEATRSASKHDFLVLDKKKVYLGRRKECDLVFKEKIISRKHVVFFWNDGQWNIECLNDKNGVFVNGKLLNKHQVKKLEDNYIISFGPNFMTDFIYQFTTKNKSDKQKTVSELGRYANSKEINLIGSKLKSNTASRPLPSPIDNKLIVARVEEMNGINLNELKINEKKIKQLNTRLKSLEDKVNKYKSSRRESRLKFRRYSSKIKLLQASNIRQKTKLRTAKLNLNRERLKKRELQKRLTEQEKSIGSKAVKKEGKNSQNIAPSSTVSNSNDNKDDKEDLKVAKKYNELFSEDFNCGICLELMISPVSLTCGHTTCKFCITEWFKRNERKRECALCRTSIHGYFKNVLIENVIDKYLSGADEELLSVRKRLIEERQKVTEKSNSENQNNADGNNRRHSIYSFDLSGPHPLIGLLANRDGNSFYNDLGVFTSSDEDNGLDDVEYEFDGFTDEEEDFEEGAFNSFDEDEMVFENNLD